MNFLLLLAHRASVTADATQEFVSNNSVSIDKVSAVELFSREHTVAYLAM